MSERLVYVLNGPNLNLLGTREPETYGRDTLEDLRERCAAEAGALGWAVEFRQSNHEGVLVDWLHEAAERARAAVLNPAGYGHGSVALLDAMLAVPIPVVECHLSNLAKREPFRQVSRVSAGAAGVISGFGPLSYTLAVRAAIALGQG